MNNHLRAVRKARGLTQRQLAERAQTTLQQVSRLERGERRLTLDWVRRMARALGCTEMEVIGPALTTVEPLTVKGAVETGNWRDSAEWPADAWYPASIPEDPRFAGVARFCLEVRDQALNRRYPKGSILVCVALDNLDGTPLIDRRVICHRRDDVGRVEVTVRELRGHRDDANGVAARHWLWPDSTDPEHQQPFPADCVEIVAVVTGGYTQE